MTTALKDPHLIMDNLPQTMLKKIVLKAKWLIALDRYLQNRLPTEFATHCCVINVNHRVLILGVDNAAIATRLRFMSAELLDALQQEENYRQITTIQCSVQAKITPYHHQKQNQL